MFSSNTTAANGAANYIEDVFSTYLYTGNGSTQTITNGIDLAGKGGLVWTKCRSVATDHSLVDTVRGADKVLHSESTAAQVTYADITAFNASGYGINDVSGWVNSSGRTYASWTFRKQPKFFDVVTYTGTGAAQTIAHSLGGTVGALIVKRTSGTGNWSTFARTSGAAGSTLYAYFNTASGLNLTAAAGASGVPAESLGYITTTGFKPNDLSGSAGAGNADNINESGATYVAYLFAHNAGGFGLTGTDNVISCGGYTGNNTSQSITLGYEPQWILAKPASGAGDWYLFDNMRGIATGGNEATLFANDSAAELNVVNALSLTATGFDLPSASFNNSGVSYIYIAIRRGPMKVPTDGTKVFSPALGTSASTIPTFVTNFPVDLGFYHSRANTADWYLSSRLQGGGTLNTNTTFAEAAPDANYAFDSNTGWGKNFNSDKASSNFRRAPGFFDEVCYTGTGAAMTVAHNLTVAPELIILKSRSDAQSWMVYAALLGNAQWLSLNSTFEADSAGLRWNDTTPTASVFSVGKFSGTTPYSCAAGSTYVAYLFASCPGVSKVGSVTHVEPTTVSCGFTPRFVLIKSTTATGTDDWFVFDSARGITAGNDPYLRLNSTGAENTPFGAADLIDPTADGFIMNGFGGGNYIFLAIA